MPLSLRVQILKARNLAAKDPNGFSDPFVVVEFGRDKQKTEVIKKNLNPVWNKEFNFPISVPPPLSLKLTVWDHDVMRPNDFLGVVYLPIDRILHTHLPNTPFDETDESTAEWIELRPRSAASKVSGEILVRAGIVGGSEDDLATLLRALSLSDLVRSGSIKSSGGSTLAQLPTVQVTSNGEPELEISREAWTSKTVQAFTLSRIGSGDVTRDLDGVLSVDVLGAHNLPPLRNATKTGWDMDPFLVVTLGDRCHRTRTVRHSLHPVWNERVLLPVTKLAAAQWPVTFSIYDQDKFTANDYIGGGEIQMFELKQIAAKATADGATTPEVLTLPLSMSTEYATVLRTPASLSIRAKYRPIAEVRASLWRKLIAVVGRAGGEDGVISSEGMLTILEAIGGAEVEDTAVEQAYARLGKEQGVDLTIEEAVRLFDDLFDVGSHDGALHRFARCPQCQFAFNSEADVIPHLDVCLEEERGADTFMMGGFVTEIHSSRKGLTKLVNKLTRGEYSIGADSANIVVLNRDNGQLIEEKIPTFVRLGIRMLYRASRTPVETTRVKNLLAKMSFKQGQKYTDPKSAAEIPKFIKYHNLNLEEILDPLDSFKNFNEFFYRKLKPDARPLASPYPEVAVSAADCRLMAFPTIDNAQELWIKGRNFTIAGLLDSTEEAVRYAGGSLVIFRLAPQDYHRFHIPVDGVLSETKNISGAYYTVNPMAIRSSIDVYLENKRAVTYIDSPTFGRVAFVAIGAMMVGGIVQTTKAGQQVQRGDEQGYFAFGGSTIVVVFEPGRIELDADLVANSKRKLETLVRVGMSIGRKPGFRAPASL